MSPEEIEKKIKQFRTEIKELELEVARNEEKQKNQTETINKLSKEILELYPECDLENLAVEIQKIQSQLETDMSLLEIELENARKKITGNG